MRSKISFYQVNAPTICFSPSAAMAAGFKILPLVEISPEEIFPVAEDAFGVNISELRDADVSVCNELPMGPDLQGSISELRIIETRSFLSAINAGDYLKAVFEHDGVFIAIFGSDETWIVHARSNWVEISEQFKNLLEYSKNNAELFGRSEIFSQYFAD